MTFFPVSLGLIFVDERQRVPMDDSAAQKPLWLNLPSRELVGQSGSWTEGMLVKMPGRT